MYGVKLSLTCFLLAQEEVETVMYEVNLSWDTSDRYFAFSPVSFSWVILRFVKSVLNGQKAILHGWPPSTG